MQASLITDHPAITAGLIVGASGFLPAEVTQALIQQAPESTHLIADYTLEEIHLLAGTFAFICTGVGVIGNMLMKLIKSYRDWDGEERRKK